MPRRRDIAAILVVLACAVLLTGDNNAAPPAIEQDGVRNAASGMPPQLSGGSIARGSVFRIRGWRLGPKEGLRAALPLKPQLGGFSIQVGVGSSAVAALPLYVSENEIQAVMPSSAPLGATRLRVARGADFSRPFDLQVVPSSFGAYSVNGSGWGQAKLSNGASGAAPNTFQDSARPGQTVTLSGTGLGVADGRDDAGHRAALASAPSILVAGRRVTAVRFAGRSGSEPGADELVFDLPADTPEGCYVPIQVRMGKRLASNTVTAAVKQGGGPCEDPANWMYNRVGHASRAGIVMLVRADVHLVFERLRLVDFRMDIGYGNFRSSSAAPGANPLYMFPPAGSCTAYTNTLKLRSMLAPSLALEMLTGEPLDAGKSLTVSGESGAGAMARSEGRGRNYSAILGGIAPLPGAKPKPLFFEPGPYVVAGGGGADVGAFRIPVQVTNSIRWTGRDRTSVVDRAKGVTLHWKAGRPEDLILLVAMNVEGNSGAMGLCACVAPAQAGSFRIPPEMLTNIPPSAPGTEGLPLNLLFAGELPARAPATVPVQGLEQALAFYASAMGRTVVYR